VAQGTQATHALRVHSVKGEERNSVEIVLKEVQTAAELYQTSFDPARRRPVREEMKPIVAALVSAIETPPAEEAAAEADAEDNSEEGEAEGLASGLESSDEPQELESAAEEESGSTEELPSGAPPSSPGNEETPEAAGEPTIETSGTTGEAVDAPAAEPTTGADLAEEPPVDRGHEDDLMLTPQDDDGLKLRDIVGWSSLGVGSAVLVTGVVLLATRDSIDVSVNSDDSINVKAPPSAALPATLIGAGAAVASVGAYILFFDHLFDDDRPLGQGTAAGLAPTDGGGFQFTFVGEF
ncbi:MAG: hypothetical protein AAFQ82_28315, partial [Myxococcota bacterium]